MAKEIAFANGRISNFEALVTLTLDRVILHTAVHHSSTSTYVPNFIEIEEPFCGRTGGRMHVRTYVRTNGRTDGRTFETGFTYKFPLKCLEQICWSSLLSSRNVCWPRRMLALVRMPTDRQTDGRTPDRCITLSGRHGQRDKQ